MNSLKAKVLRIKRRKTKIKSKLRQNLSRARLCISKSNKSMYAQIIDDQKGSTLVALSTLSKEFSDLKSRVNKDAAKKLGAKIAEKAKTSGVTKVVFDRNGYLYHGVVAAFADGLRANGIVL